MRETRVSYELALRLEVVGFNWECSHAYNEEGKLESAINYVGRPTFDEDDIKSSKDNGMPSVLAPTLGHVEKWFRKVHNISVTAAIDITEVGEEPLQYWAEIVTGIDCADTSTWHAGEFNLLKTSHDEALEEGLKYATHLIDKS